MGVPPESTTVEINLEEADGKTTCRWPTAAFARRD